MLSVGTRDGAFRFQQLEVPHAWVAFVWKSKQIVGLATTIALERGHDLVVKSLIHVDRCNRANLRVTRANPHLGCNDAESNADLLGQDPSLICSNKEERLAIKTKVARRWHTSEYAKVSKHRPPPSQRRNSRVPQESGRTRELQ